MREKKEKKKGKIKNNENVLMYGKKQHCSYVISSFMVFHS